MMLVVSDTGPLNYLVLIGCAEVLPMLFSEVYIPARVLKELEHEKTPEIVKLWAKNLPEWVRVKKVVVDKEFANLDAGETEALVLATSLSARYILLDDHAARLTAEKCNITPIGTLGILLRAANSGFLDFDESFAKLQTTTFRMSKDLVEAIQKRQKS